MGRKMVCETKKAVNIIKDKMYALIEEDYEGNYNQILDLSQKLDEVLNTGSTKGNTVKREECQ